MGEAANGRDDGIFPGIEWTLGVEVGNSKTDSEGTQFSVNLQVDAPQSFLSKLPLYEPCALLVDEAARYKATCDERREEERRERARGQCLVADATPPANTQARRTQRGRGGHEPGLRMQRS